MEFLLDELIESLHMLPFLFGAYLLIGLIESLTSRKFRSKALSHPVAPLVGAGFGLLPECGFSVVATDMFTQKKITIGTLIAIYLATSDEALPLIITQPDKISYLLPMLLIKFFYGAIIGFTIDGFIKLRNKKLTNINLVDTSKNIALTENTEINNTAITSSNDSEQDGQPTDHCEHSHIGCCGHSIEEDHKEHWTKRFLLHPVLHTIKIFAFILVINLAFATIIHFVGEDTLKNFLGARSGFAPLFSVVIGLIPNCASSLIITDLFINGSLSFGAMIAGLSANAGLGLVVLMKQNKSIKTNISIITMLVIASLILGYAIQLTGLL